MIAHLLLVLLGVVFSAFCTCSPIGFSGDGIVDPGSHYQRFRRAEYPASEPYFQWWYYCFKDMAANRYFAVSYMYSESSNKTTSGAFLQVAMVDRSSGDHFVRMHQLPLSSFEVSGDFNVSIGGQYSIFVPDTLSNVVRVRGAMRSTDKSYYYDGSIDAYQFVDITWDITLQRIYGWYGQPEFETYTHELFPVILWNTYTHNAWIADGSFVSFGSLARFAFAKDQGYRAYGDMNWGRTFPHPPSWDVKDHKYAWGWYDVMLPSVSGAEDVAIIAGVGETWTGFPLATVVGSFADIRLSDSVHVGLRCLTVWNTTEDPLMLSNDGKVYDFHVDRSNWTVFKDSFGTADIPLTQVVTLETAHYRAVLSFVSERDDYNRLVFPFEDFIFSDFEGLGVHVDVQVFTRPAPEMSSWTLAKNFSVENGGLEFGYHVVDGEQLRV
eukprot:ANDGO_03896.mRNA.1 hypothetical protein